MNSPPGDKRPLAASEGLSQFGHSGKPVESRPFKNRPLFDQDQTELSLTIGNLSADEARKLIAPLLPPEGSGVRYTTVGRLREAGFAVRHNPTPHNPNHVSVAFKAEWNEKVDIAFDQCFDTPNWWSSHG
jgi:hypothetical protein